ncbi:FAD-binding oxidoreductase [Rhizobium rhizogenes]|jgi:gamma-glutamylputrescine oxidase|uniref:NAD(P)/FAD-dependent oxidoreductase n=1 Tax=Rhizobium rhizogenes TaxID=359 RepID=UPI0015748A73|nr:FAD-binding oxidoreductase [Rhizobium rhizogenes]NTF85403.1 FAD-binding oxidoreductase [Rhizobium rhizogenes]NTI26651.1 FAD-binding oxidoreductase [Rhizobium rhizogenes]NTI31320.1 FAD-binding oxidoreductase [Rhizobium rhizogenes]NTI78208.1 FAD-binding oxidoreductase [Rhizobium rhizogenes]QTG08650.1 FAD-binding oxidoreductase [Rhizobium rhizogenes]
MDLLTINDRPGLHPDSYYAATASNIGARPAAKGEIRCDVCVIGGGYTGLSSALHLAKKGYRVVLLEANRLGWGASGRNGGQVNTGMRLHQDELERMFGSATAHGLWNLAGEAVTLVEGLIRDHGIACAFKRGVLTACHRRRYVEETRIYTEKLQGEYGVEGLTFLDRDAFRAILPSGFYQGGSLDTNAGHLHPLNYLLGLARAAEQQGVEVFETSRVVRIDHASPVTVHTDCARVSADFVIIGCNGYAGDLDRDIARHVMPINGFIAATRPLSEKEAASVLTRDYAAADTKFVINYFRLSEDRRLLFGGGESYGYRFPANLDAVVRRPLRTVYPQLRDIEFDYCWGGTLGITMSRMPYFRRLRGNILTAGGFSGQGVALATLAGKLLADAIAGQAEKFDLMASLPASPFPGGPRWRSPLLALAMTWYALRDSLS